MSLTNPNKIVTEERLSNFYNRILPYLGGNDADSVPYDNTNSGLTSGNVQDAIDELNESKASPLTNAEMTAIKNAFDATNTSKFATTYTKYSTEEQVVGEWIDGKPLYQKTISFVTGTIGASAVVINAYIATGLLIKNVEGYLNWSNGSDSGIVNLSCFLSNTNKAVYSINNGTLKIDVAGAHFSNQTGYATIQYTKTTD